MIRVTVLRKIKETIDRNKHFSSSDFRFEAENGKFLIQYEYDTQFFFRFNIPTETSELTKKVKETSHFPTFTSTYVERPFQDYKFTGTVIPGDIALKEDFDFAGEEVLFKKIGNWLNNLWEELLEVPINREISEQAKIIEELKNKVEHIPDDYFSNEEGELLRKKLDELEKKFEEQISQEIEDADQLREKISQLSSEIETLKATIFSVKKKGWFKSFITKTYSWIAKEDNRKLIKDGKKIIELFLPENMKDIIN